MKRTAWMALIASATVAAAAFADDTDAPPAAFAPFEHLVGAWKGQAVTPKDRLKGWRERHLWAWRFEKGKPVGMTLEVTGGRAVAKARLSHDEKAGRYVLEGTDPADKAIRFEGPLDEATGLLRLERVALVADSPDERLEIALNQNQIRYTMRLFRREVGAPQAALAIDAGVTKEGESFAAGGAAADLPKCIVTGGAGALTVAFEGKSYPVCCEGCKEQFSEDPPKYIQRYLARMAKGEAPPPKAEAPTESPTAAAPETPAKPAATKPKADAEAKAMPKPAEPKAGAATANAKRAASMLSLAGALEKAGKTAEALAQYRRIAKDFPDSPSANAASAKIKALEKK